MKHVIDAITGGEATTFDQVCTLALGVADNPEVPGDTPAALRATAAHVLAMTEAECAAAAEADHRARYGAWHLECQAIATKRQRLLDRLWEFDQWLTPPTPEAAVFRRSMIDHLRRALSELVDPPEPVKYSGEEWRIRQAEAATVSAKDIYQQLRVEGGKRAAAQALLDVILASVAQPVGDAL